MIDKIQGKLHIVETYIPIEEQSKYFKSVNRIRKNMPEKEEVLAQKDLLFDPDYEVSSKKKLLVWLAGLGEVEAYRAIELYAATPDETLQYWAKMALEESRMMMDRMFTDREPIMLATGLGGRGEKLRFFVVAFPNQGEIFSEFQQTTTQKEISYALSENNCELEDITLMPDYIAFTALFPFRSDMQELLTTLFREINQYGNFISEPFLVTNMKIYGAEEIREQRANFEKERLQAEMEQEDLEEEEVQEDEEDDRDGEEYDDETDGEEDQ